MNLQVNFDDEVVLIFGEEGPANMPMVEFVRTGGEELEDDIDAALASINLARVSPKIITEGLLTGSELNWITITAA